MSLKSKPNSSGFTLIELMVATFVLALVLVAILGSYITCLDLVELSKNTSVAMNIAQTKMEEIKNSTYTQIKTNYDRVPFAITGLTGMGVSYVDNTNPDLLQVTVTVCWRQKNGRIIGEDTNLNGGLDAGEDKSNPLNNQLDSLGQVVSYIAKH